MANQNVVARDFSVEGIEPLSRTASISTEQLSLPGLRNECPSAHIVDVRVHNLSITIDAAAESPLSSIDAFKARILGSRNKPPSKQILKDVSADFPSRSLSAIVGASGSGKTMLLNMISNRMKAQKFRKSGTITYQASNGSPNQNRSYIKPGVAYVLQQDVLLPTLTVRETLQYAADLRLSAKKTKAERYTMVETVIAELGLETCANTKIGDRAHKGCSGGEIRRTSIGIQLLTDQPILILDEPTTGLDAASAIKVVQSLQSLARRGKTIIMTIHQPRSEIWRLVDTVIVLSRGSPLYSGPVRQCLPYFEQAGYKMPAFSNPFDFIIDLAAIDSRSTELEKICLSRVQQLQRVWRSRSVSCLKDMSEPTPGESLHGKQITDSGNSLNALVNETMVLTRRTFVVTYRDRLGLLASMIESISMGTISGWIFYQLGSDLSGVKSRQGALYTASAVQSYLVLIFETYRLSVDIGIYDRERIEGVSRPVSLILSRRLGRTLLEDLPVPLFFSLIFYFMAGFRPEAGQFLIFLAVQIITHLITVNLAMVCVALNRQFMAASLFANLSFTLQTFACGFFINTQSLAIWLRWMKWTSYVFYSFGTLCTNEFMGRFYDCPNPGGPSNSACKEYTGEYILDALNLPSNWLWRPIVALLGFKVFFFGLSAIVLQLNTTEVEMAKTQQSHVDYTSTSPESSTRTATKDSTITITLDNFGMDLETKRPFKRTMRKQIFSPINTIFEPNVLNVILGPSGSGKSTCLNAIARRLQGSPLLNYSSSGKILLNGSTATDEVMKSICSYVPQDDYGLLPSLTVRETLNFAARLRLPSFLSHDQKIQRAESVLLQLGLKDYADTVIGSDFLKGISGGEKRRVSIGVQILTDPKVLLLDEPTSGLDSFTACSIVGVLKGLANEGRTIILSIHQPRSDIFSQFGGILLLAKGGDVAYTGSVSYMLPYFEKLGYKCPESTNPADFALDLASVEKLHSLQQQEGIPVSTIKANEKAIASARTINPSPLPVTPSKECHLALPAQLGVYTCVQLPFRRAFPILLQRGLINLRRQPNLMIGRVTQVMGLGLVLAAFVAPLQNDYYAVQSRVGFILSMSSMFFVGMLNSIAMYPTERDICYHEDRDNTYPVEAFFFYYTAVEIPFELVGSMLYAVLTVFAAGLPRTAGQFFLMAYVAFSVVSCGESFGILFLTMFSHTGLAVSVMTVVLSISVSLAGVLSTSMNGFWTAVSYISPVKWQVGALLSYTLRGITFTCTDQQKLSNGNCPIQTGEQVLQLYNLDVNTVKFALALGVVAIGYRLLAYLGLKIRRMDWKGLMKMDLRRRKECGVSE